MVRSWSLLLGIGLVFLGLAGLGGTNAAGSGQWMVWLDFVAAFLSFVVAATLRPEAPRSEQVSGPGMLSIGLFIMWVVALIIGNVPTALVWWNFAFAVAYGLLTMLSKEGRKPLKAQEPSERDRPEQQRPPRRAA
ncbi:MAG: hypothetical protein HY074_17205 [Deltaproteobacteria bacterium]|nr:hypothetical protein [Deltaproteobacteria bacterium]